MDSGFWITFTTTVVIIIRICYGVTTWSTEFIEKFLSPCFESSGKTRKNGPRENDSIMRPKAK